MFKKVFYVGMFLSLIVSNILSLTSSVFHSALYSLIDRLPYAELRRDSPTNKKKALNTKLVKQQKAMANVTKVSSRISKRVVRNASMNLASIPAEAVPMLGIATIVTVTSVDLYDACQTLKDLDSLSIDFNGASTETEKVCGYEVPSKEEVLKLIQDEYEKLIDSSLTNIFSDETGL